MNRLRKPSTSYNYNDDLNYEKQEFENVETADVEQPSSPKKTRRISKISKSNSTNEPEDEVYIPKRSGKRKQSVVKDLLKNDKNGIGNILESELVNQINLLKEELNDLKVENESLIKANNLNKEMLEEKSKEIEILNEKLKIFKEVVKKNESEIYNTKKNYYSSNANSNQQEYNNNNISSDSINALKQQNLDLFSDNEIFKIKYEELQKINLDLNSLNENLQIQLNTSKDKYANEMNDLYSKIADLEKTKVLLELKMKENSSISTNAYLTPRKESSGNMSASKSLNTSSLDQSGTKSRNIVTNLKNEVKILQKKNEDDKIIFENTVNIINEELKAKTLRIEELTQSLRKAEIEKCSLSEKVENIQKDYFQYINQANDYKCLGENALLKIERLNEINSKQKEFELRLNNTVGELESAKSDNEALKQTIERHKKMEIALKNELVLKEQELAKRSEMIKSIQAELSNINANIFSLNKENITLKSKLDLTENDILTKYDMELNAKNHELFILNEKISNFERHIENIKDKLLKKENMIKLKKQANFTLVEIIKSKRNEVKCLEAMQFMNSAVMIENIKKIRDKENEYLSQYFSVFFIFQIFL